MTEFTIPVLTIAGIACATDLATRRIPNVLTFGAAAAALVAQGMFHGPQGLLLAAGGWVTGFIMLFPLFFVRGLGAGDVKLVAAIGAWMGPTGVIWVALYTAVAGGIVGTAYALARGYLHTALSNLTVIGNHWMFSGFQPVPGLTLENSERPRLPYALPILLGTVVTLWLH